MSDGLTPLPSGWTQHTAPTGHKYYYNASLKKSTYQRPTEQHPPPLPVHETPTRQLEPPPTLEQIQNTALIVPKKDQFIPLTEWTSEMAIEPSESQVKQRQTARLMSDDMWKKLEDRPRKK